MSSALATLRQFIVALGTTLNNRDVAHWHEADIVKAAINVCFRSKSSHGADTLRCRLLTQSGHCRALFEANNARGREVHPIN
jgi:hypothetical protein